MNTEQLRELKERLLTITRDIDEAIEDIDDVLYPRRIDADGEL